MSSTAAVTNSFKQEILQGIHAAADTYNVALYTAAASLGASTTAYTASGEVSGTGYSAGGQALSGFTVSISGNVAYLTWSSNPSWPSSTLTGVVTALIYNASKSNKSVCVLTFPSASTAGGPFTLVLPAAGATSPVTLT